MPPAAPSLPARAATHHNSGSQKHGGRASSRSTGRAPRRNEEIARTGESAVACAPWQLKQPCYRPRAVRLWNHCNVATRIVLLLLSIGACASLTDGSNRKAKRALQIVEAKSDSSNGKLPYDRDTVEPASGGDADGDGIDDATELSLAKNYFPYYSVEPNDRCGRHAVLFRLTRHPQDATKIAIWYVVLFERDCGLHGIGGHAGDDEVFGEIVDPTLPAPDGILALRAISHQNTVCEHVTSCGTLPNCAPCVTANKSGRAFPVVFASRDKHGNYVSTATCHRSLCDVGCTLSSTPDGPMFVNAGEPGRPLVRDLTRAGMITSESGWTEPPLINFDPWGNRNFGRAGNVTDDLLDDSFLVSPSGC